MKRSELPCRTSLGYLLIATALISSLLMGQNVYAGDKQAYIWNIPANLSLQGNQDQVSIPTATLTPTSPANIRNLPTTKGTEIVGKVAKGTPYPVLGFVIRDDGQWYYLSLPDGGYGWVRSDVVPAPVGDDLWDLSDVAALPLATSEAKLGEMLLEANINLALIQSAFDTLISRSVPTETFTADNIELIGILGQNLIFRLKNSVQGNEVGTVLTVIEDEDGLQDAELFSPGQLRDALSKNGIQAEGEFSVAYSPDQYLRFGSTVLFNYVQAASRLAQGKDREDALLSSVIVSDTAFPDTLFSISAADTRKQMVFTEGQAYDLSQNEGEGFLRAKKLDIAVMTPFVVAAQLNLPQGSYIFDTNVTFGPNKMLEDAAGNIVAVSSVDGDVWQTAETISASMNLDTKAEDGSKLKYIFWGDQGNLFVREQRDNGKARGLQAILNETDGAWHNLRIPFEQIVASGFTGPYLERGYNPPKMVMNVVSAGERVGLQLPIPETDGAVASKLIRTYYFQNPGTGVASDFSMETALVTVDFQYHGYNFSFIGNVPNNVALRPGIGITGEFPMVTGDTDPFPELNTSINTEAATAYRDMFLDYSRHKQDTLHQLINDEQVIEPIFMNLKRPYDPTIFVQFP